MRVKPELDPDVDDEAPTRFDLITPYDEVHYVTYLRLLDAESDGADWTEVARIVLHRDPATDPARTRRCWESHLARVHWMTKRGYRRILETGRSRTQDNVIPDRLSSGGAVVTFESAFVPDRVPQRP